MGTRGIVGFKIDGEYKLTYNHWDSYPEGLGVGVLNFCRENTADALALNALIADVRRLQVVDESSKPTKEQIESLKHLHDSGVSTGSEEEWYSLLRKAQGDLEQYLVCGYMVDNHFFTQDSLFCEWGYVVDLDALELRCFRGFNDKGLSGSEFDAWFRTEPNWQPRYDGDKQWYPIVLAGTWDLQALPTDDAFTEALNASVPEEVDA